MRNFLHPGLRFHAAGTINTGMNVDGFFAGHPESRLIFDRVWAQASLLGPVVPRVTKSQVAFVRDKPFAWAWMPAMYLHRNAAPLVLALSFRERRPWTRWKEIYEAAPGRFTHHLELWSPEDVDGEVQGWLREAWEQEQRRTSGK
jgi:hypothetical protein